MSQTSVSRPSPQGPPDSHIFAPSQLPAHSHQVFSVADWLGAETEQKCDLSVVPEDWVKKPYHSIAHYVFGYPLK